MLRIGIGYDIHRLISRRKLILGGLTIPYSKGLAGHSDADVLLHAICDALLGAAGLKDIGEHFPDSDSRYKDISSVKLLKATARFLKKRKYSINNLDTVIITQQPHLARFKKKISTSIARTLNLSVKRVNVKATTAEGLGIIGKGKAIAALACALIEKR